MSFRSDLNLIPHYNTYGIIVRKTCFYTKTWFNHKICENMFYKSYVFVDNILITCNIHHVMTCENMFHLP